MERNVAAIILYDDQKRILLQHRTDDAPTHPGYWALFGGGIERGEESIDAVKRECMEELDYKLESPRLCFSQEFVNEYNSGRIDVYIEKYDPSKKLTQNEGQGMKWVKCEEALSLKIVDLARSVLEFISKNRQLLS